MNSGIELVNRISKSSLITIKLEDFFPENEILVFDLKDYLFQGLILKEMDFRAALKSHDWSQYQHHILAVYCSTDAIIPTWAYMLVASHATEKASDIYFGDKDAALRNFFTNKIRNMEPEEYRDAKLVIKGCSDKPVPASAYLDLTAHLSPVAQSIMYGEPCSTVPVYKRKA
ncbi:MAG: DUF2480 family protein [Bacteroidota bacterium]|nr:DUF2480 family protein [Bacteroidota bacterium]